MTYCTIAQVSELMSRINANAGFSSSTVPNTTQVTDIMAQVAAEIDLHLSSAGYGSAVTSPATLVAWLALVNAEGACAIVLKSYAPESVSSPNGGPVIPAYSFYEHRYRDALSLIDNRKISLDGSSMLAATYLTDYPENDGNDGMTEGQQPVFSMKTVF